MESSDPTSAARGDKDGVLPKKTVAKATFPLSRIKTIMKSSPDASTLGVDAVALTAKAAELFVVYLAEESLKDTGRTKVDYSDIYKVVHGNPVLDFLYDIIPQKITYRECKLRIEEAERKEKQALMDIEI